MNIKRIFFSFLTALFLLSTLMGCSFPGIGVPGSTTARNPESVFFDGSTDAGSYAFTVRFLDVGQADAALIVCDGKAMLIDGGNAADSSILYTALKNQGISELEYVVCTHEHEDHAGGLPGALAYAKAKTALVPLLTPVNSTSDRFTLFLEKVREGGGTVKVPTVGERFSLGSAEFTVLSPIVTSEEPNETSLVLRMVYGETSFLFTGDAGEKSERAMLDAGTELRSTVLKVGHHGSASSTSYRFLREVNPACAVISVGKGNTYGHPAEATLSRLRDADVTVLRTDETGDILCGSDGKTVRFFTGKSGEVTAGTRGTEPAVTEYPFVGNIETKKYHRVTCSSLPKEENRIWFTSADEAEKAGYSPCGICKPGEER